MRMSGWVRRGPAGRGAGQRSGVPVPYLRAMR